MFHQKQIFGVNKLKNLIWILLVFPIISQASFIESTIGTAVVDDATATYYNPAALSLLKNPQIVTLGSIAYFRTKFTGQATQVGTGFTQSGTTKTQTNYFLPSGYFATPVTKNFFWGTAVVSNLFTRDIEQDSVLRYVQSNNSIQDIDLIPAFGIKLNDLISIGAALNFSDANFTFQATSGFPTLNIPDSQSHNEANAHSLGEDVGLLLKPTKSTLIGLNYRSSMTFHFMGTSTFEGASRLISNNYSFNFWTPARVTLSVNQFVTPKLGFIGTVHWVQWSIFDTVNIQGIATQSGTGAVIIPNASVPYHLHNSWIFTFGSHYKITPKWVIRAAGSYLQSPGNPNFQVTHGDSVVVGASTGYNLNKYISLDAAYAHAFIKNQNINIVSNRNNISGVNEGSRDSVSLKLIFNLT